MRTRQAHYQKKRTWGWAAGTQWHRTAEGRQKVWSKKARKKEPKTVRKLQNQ